MVGSTIRIVPETVTLTIRKCMPHDIQGDVEMSKVAGTGETYAAAMVAAESQVAEGHIAIVIRRNYND